MYEIHRLATDHPITITARTAQSREHGHNAHGTPAELPHAIDTEVINTAAKPLSRHVCYASYAQAARIAEALNRLE